MNRKNFPALPAVCMTLAIAGLISCGSDHSTSQQAPAKRSVQGAVVKGPVHQAMISASAIDEGGDATGDPTPGPSTDDNGQFIFNLVPFTDTLTLVSTTSGSHVD